MIPPEVRLIRIAGAAGAAAGGLSAVANVASDFGSKIAVDTFFGAPVTGVFLGSFVGTAIILGTFLSWEIYRVTR